MVMASFLNLMNQLLPTSNFSSAVSLFASPEESSGLALASALA